ncbi:hypothetical protein CE91St3_33290 [Parabacteroides merdae]|uniref:Uncharacterized protein n=2 Tax=Bacteroidales TaxID=171549 RepID=A0AA37K8X1_9BACT|nr:hypothetical protein CE91St3_33290 [Parabacteroides merdae]
MSRSIKEYTVRMESIRRLLTNKSDEITPITLNPDLDAGNSLPAVKYPSINAASTKASWKNARDAR